MAGQRFAEEGREQPGGIVHGHVVEVIRFAQRHLAGDIKHVRFDGPIKVEPAPPAEFHAAALRAVAKGYRALKFDPFGAGFYEMARAEKGLETMIGEGGLKLSGGEKQRLSIARALLRKPRVLLFDEATSALDSLTEEEITNTIRNISELKSQVTILIAHRLSTIMHADKIFVLEKGEVEEIGTHEELLDKKGLYFAMWRQQIGERKYSLIKQSGSLNSFI